MTEEKNPASAWARYDLNLLLGLAIWFFTIAIVGIGLRNLYIFIDIPALFLVGGMMVGVWVIGLRCDGCWQTLGLLCRLAYRHKYQFPPAQGRLAIQACELGVSAAFLSGTAGTLIGLIAMLRQGMDAPQALTCGMAVALITSLYSVLAAAFLVALRTRIQLHLQEAEGEPVASLPAIIWKTAGLALLILLGAEIAFGTLLYIMHSKPGA